MPESLAFGTAVTVDTDPIGNLVGLKWGGITIDTTETSHHDMPSKMRTLRKTLGKGENLVFTVQATSANLALLIPLADPDSPVQAWAIIYPFEDGPQTVAFDGHLVKFELGDADPDGLILADIEVAPTGDITVTPPP